MILYMIQDRNTGEWWDETNNMWIDIPEEILDMTQIIRHCINSFST